MEDLQNYDGIGGSLHLHSIEKLHSSSSLFFFEWSTRQADWTSLSLPLSLCLCLSFNLLRSSASIHRRLSESESKSSSFLQPLPFGLCRIRLNSRDPPRFSARVQPDLPFRRAHSRLLTERIPNRKISHTMKPLENGESDLEGGRLGRDRERTPRSGRTFKMHNQALLSGLAYCISSCSMILVNKFVLSSYDFNAGISLMLYQNLISVIIVSTLSIFGVISTEPLTLNLIKVWLPVNVIFVGMLVTSMFSLKYINVAMVTVLKNVTNVITAVGEMYLFNKHHDNRVWAALFLMIISAISGGITDISFHAIGYAWQITNCFLTASYSLTLRRVMDTAKQVTKSGNLNEFSMVLLNNTLSLPLGVILICVFNEVDYLMKTPLLRLPTFWLVITFSGILGLAISFTSMWFLHQTGATTYSLVGSLNKIPLSIAGIFLFKVPTSLENSASILFGLLAGVFFARAKIRERS